MREPIQDKVNLGIIDINNSQLFMATLLRALMYNLNHQIKLRDKSIPHFILNTGDDIMYLENKGQDMSVEPQQVSNEDYIYNSLPRCIVDMSTIEVMEDQVTSPFTRGNFDIEDNDIVYGFNAEFRRMPLKVSVTLKYYLDTFNDSISVTQMIISKMLFIRTFKFDYMGQTIQASYKVPSSYNTEKNITFDGGTTDQKTRTIEVSLEVETNMPIYNERTAILNDKFIRNIDYGLTADGTKLTPDDNFIVTDRDKEIEYLEHLLEEYKDKDNELRLLLEQILRKLNKKELE